MHFTPIEHISDEAYIAYPYDSFQVEMHMQDSYDALDDVFGSASTTPTAEHHPDFAYDASHPSDMYRLQAEHSANGYREGVTVAKESSIQAGFDEGFSLGASIGLKAGQLLGVIEGIADATRGLQDANSLRVKELVREARKDLSIATIFKPDYWDEDAIWKYHVPSPSGEEEVIFTDAANAHPLIRKWTEVVDEQMAIWHIDRTILDDDFALRFNRLMDEPITSSAAPSARKPLDW